MSHILSRKEVDYFQDFRGTLGVLEFKKLPFVPRRIYWIFDSTDNASRGGHAHKLLKQAFVVLSGSVEIDIFRGPEKFSLSLVQQGSILILQPGYWRNFRLLTPESLLLVLCDREYDESDYIKDWQEYLEWFRANEP